MAAQVSPQMTREVLESDTEGYLCARVKELRGDQRKFKEKRGDPDRIVFLPDVPAFLIECKRPKGGRHQPLQKRRRAHFRKLGVHTYLCKTRADVEDVLSWELGEASDGWQAPCQG